MFRNENEEVKEEKVESTLICHSRWPAKFQYAVALSDGVHLAAITPAFSLATTDKLTIWNIKEQHLLWEVPISWDVNAMTSLKNMELVIADRLGQIHQFTVKRGVPRHTTTIPTMKTEISAISALNDESLAILHGDSGSVSIWDLKTKKEIKAFTLEEGAVCAMDTQHDGSLLLCNTSGSLFIYNILENNCRLICSLGCSNINSMVLLPDNTIVYTYGNGDGDGDGDANLIHYDLTNTQILSSQKVDPARHVLTPMPNGWIGCVIELSFLLLEPSWVRNYVDTNLDEVKKEAARYLPVDLTAIVTAYAANITLFHSPKMPHQKECVLENNLPRPKGS